MNTRMLPTLAAVVIAIAGAIAMTSAMAVEATQYVPEAGTSARADVKADLRDTKTNAGVL